MPTADDLEEAYLRALVRECAPLDFAVFEETDPTAGKDGQGGITVSDVFTTLYLKGVNRREDQSVRDAIVKPDLEILEDEGRKRTGMGRKETGTTPVQATEAVEALDRLVVLGAPGGGKSTLVNHMAARLARLRLGEIKESGLPGWPDDSKPLPVRIVLRRFAAKLPKDDGRGSADLVWDYLKKLLERWGCGRYFDSFQQALRRDGGVVFFDGLDEVRRDDAQLNRTRMVEAMDDFAQTLDNVRVVVTCREYAYRKDDVWRLPDSKFPLVELDLFRDEQIEAFVSRWYAVTGRARGWPKDQAEDRAANLVAAIRSLPHLAELAPYPLLLTLMSIVHGATGLPRDRADLYERAVRLLLATWENRIEVDVHGKREVSPSTILKLGISVDALRGPLEKLALAAHEAQESNSETAEGCADLDLLDIQNALLKITGNSRDKADEIIGYINRRAGLLQARDHRTFTFPHRTFQEYLAATGIMRRSDFPIFLRDRIRRNLSWWKEVFLLAAGSTRDTPYNIYQLVDQILPDPAKTGITPEGVRRAVLAAQTFHEANFRAAVESEDPAGSFGRVFEWTRDWLMKGMVADDVLKPAERNEAGTALNWVGDPRFRENFHFLPDDELLGFVHVPGGSFQMGSDDYGDEKPPHEVTLPEFFIARFPVTVAQFRAYVKATGERPDAENSLKGPDNHPVVYVSWHEAMAYCRWLQTVLKNSEAPALEPIRECLQAGWRVRLPTEAEWERSARGTDGRRYPWGKDPDPNRANYVPSNIGGTSAVGCFPDGESTVGCLDMSGNVDEWTVSFFGDYPYTHDGSWNNETAEDESARVVRGGAFDHIGGYVRCAFRDWFNPDDRHWFHGFRFCVAPNPTL
jgi:formylglycine-generating enzyme required for sulfatase activity